MGSLVSEEKSLILFAAKKSISSPQNSAFGVLEGQIEVKFVVKIVKN